jgi:sugar O-acyltransferase (sialic acid O-acetyltransferase NeuD family)
MSAAQQKSIILLGAGGHARACIDVIEQEGRFVIAGLLGVANEVGNSVLGYPVIGTNADADLATLLTQHPYALVALGQIKTPALRIACYQQLVGRCELPVIISPRAYVSRHARLGEGSIVLHGAIVNAGAQVGKNCIINSQSLLEHDVLVGDHCHIATGARVNGAVRIGDGCFIGSGATIRQGVVIGANCLIGMGATVLSDCAEGTQLPAKRIER